MSSTLRNHGTQVERDQVDWLPSRRDPAQYATISSDKSGFDVLYAGRSSMFEIICPSVIFSLFSKLVLAATPETHIPKMNGDTGFSS